MGELLRMSDFTSSSVPIRIPTLDGDILVSVDDALKWINPEAPRHILFKMLLIAARTGTDPFAGEIYVYKYGDKWQVVFDKAGWLHRAESHPMFDGFDYGIIVRRWTKDTGPIGRSYMVPGMFLEDDDEVLVGGWATVYRKDRRKPSHIRLSLDDYRGKGNTWDRMTCTMIAKTALIQALRHSGVIFEWRGYDKHEMPATEVALSRPDPGPVDEVIDVEYANSPTPSLDVDMMVELKRMIRDLNISDATVSKWLEKRGVYAIGDLTNAQAQDIISKLKAKADQRDAGKIILPDPRPETVVNGEVIDGLPQSEKDRLTAKGSDSDPVEPHPEIGDDGGVAEANMAEANS